MRPQMLRWPLLLLALAAMPAAVPAAPADPGSVGSMTMPGLGGDFQLNSEMVRILPSTGAIHAWDTVRIRSTQYDIDCDDLMYNESEHSMTATGSVRLVMGNMTSVATALEFNTETSEMTLQRHESGDDQPYIIQTGDGSTLTTFADVIDIYTDENGENVVEFEGDVRIQSASDEAEEGPTSLLAPPSFQIPGLEEGGTLECEHLMYWGEQGAMQARGGVAVDTPDMRLQCQDLDYDQALDQMVALGEEVHVERDDVEVLCTKMTYLLSLGRIDFERRFSADPQPQLWQVREDSIFHAVADLITVDEAVEGEDRVRFGSNYVLETLPLESATEESDEPATRTARRLESIEDLPGAAIDPFA